LPWYILTIDATYSKRVVEGFHMDLISIFVIVVGGMLVTGLTVLLIRKPQNTSNHQIELIGRLAQMAEANAAQQAQLSERLQAQERALSKTLEDRLTALSKRVNDNLQESSTKTGETMIKLQERLAVIDAAQKNITELSS